MEMKYHKLLAASADYIKREPQNGICLIPKMHDKCRKRHFCRGRKLNALVIVFKLLAALGLFFFLKKRSE